MKFDKRNIADEPQQVSKAFVLLTLLISTLSAFLFGCATRIHHQFAESAKFDAINNNIAPWTKDQSKLIVVDKLSNVSQDDMTNLGMSVDFGFCSDSVGSVPYFLPDTTIKQSDSFWSELNQNLHLRLATPTSRACYEALVHPAMISHLSPKRVAIIGQDQDVLHEVLKHTTVNKVDVYSIGHPFRNITSIGDVELTVNHNVGFVAHGTHDVIIVSDAYFLEDATGINAMHDALVENGVLVSLLGVYSNIKQLQEIGFKSIHLYEETLCRSNKYRNIVVAFKDYTSRRRWYQTEAEAQIQIHKRGLGKLSLDASAMTSFQVPSKAHENAFCKVNGNECDFDFPSDHTTLPMSYFNVRKSAVSDSAGRGLFAAQDIPRHTLIAFDLQVQNFHVLPSTWEIIDHLYYKKRNEWSNKLFQGLLFFIQGYGYGSQLLGETHWTIDSSILLFSNHGCNCTYNYGIESLSPLSEDTVSLEYMPDEFDGSEASPYSPFQERHLRAYSGLGDYTLHEIKQGEEILTNYLSFVDPSEWEEEVEILRSQCHGKEAGEVSDYEMGDKTYLD